MRHLRSALILLVMATATLPSHVSATPPGPSLLSITVQGADLRAAFSDGRVLRGAELIGATLDYAPENTQTASIHVTIAAAFPDPRDPAGEVWLFDLRVPAPDGGTASICDPDPDGKRLAIPVPTPEGPGAFTFTCSAGAVGKCIRFGYHPWGIGPDHLTPLAALHAACVRLIRADYGGTGHGWTRTGMRIDIWDRLGIQKPDPAGELPFEAGWTPTGAVCVAHPRVPENGNLAAILAEQPHLAGHTGPAECTAAIADGLGAMLFNRSAAPQDEAPPAAGSLATHRQ